jgi:hypothetical protein
MFDAQITSHETTLDTLTDAERAELNAWFDQQQRNAWQDREDDLQQPQDDYVWDDDAIEWEEGFHPDNLYPQ